MNQSAELMHAFFVVEQGEKRVSTHDFHDAIHVVSQKAQGIFSRNFRFTLQESKVSAVVPLNRPERMFDRAHASPKFVFIFGNGDHYHRIIKFLTIETIVRDEVCR